MAPAGAGQSAISVRWPQAARLSPEFRGSLRGSQRGADSPWRPVQPVDGRWSANGLSSGRGVWPRRADLLPRSPSRLPKRRAAAWRRSGTRSSTSTWNIPTWRSSRTITAPCEDRGEAGDLPAISPRRFGAGVGPAVLPGPEPASIASSTRCAPRGSWSCRWTTSATSSLPAYARRRRRPRSWGRCRKAICRRRSRGCPAACPRIWPACTRCPC